MIGREQSKLLVVDDTRVNRVILETRLRDRGYEVASATDGREAQMLLGIGPTGADRTSGDANDIQPGPEFDLVILDVMMPEIDGLEVLRRLREQKSAIELPVIMATANDRSQDVVDALKLGANDYVTKPIDIPVLLARIETQIALKRAHQALRSAQQSLIQAAKMESIGYLAAGVAHEIRNPLAQIQMGVEALRPEPGSGGDEESAAVLEIIESAVWKADKIVSGLMEFSSSAQLNLQLGDLNQVVSQTLELIADELKAHSIELNLQLNDSVPEIRIADGELRKILVNIYMNAVQAMTGGGTLTVRTSERILAGIEEDEEDEEDEESRSGHRPHNGDHVVILEIEDTGPGIAEEKLQTVFDAFFTTRATGTGTGLGLSIAKKIIDLHDGMITVENRADRSGVRVSIALKINGIGVRTQD